MKNDKAVNTAFEYEPNSDERLFALLSHLSVLLGGILLPVIIWATQKEKSQFVRFHSLQAIYFQLSMVVLIILLVIIFVVVIFIFSGGIAFFASSSRDAGGALPFFMIILMIVFYGGIFVISFGMIGYSIYLAIKSYNGKWVMIPVIGKKIYDKIFYGS